MSKIVDIGNVQDSQHDVNDLRHLVNAPARGLDDGGIGRPAVAAMADVHRLRAVDGSERPGALIVYVALVFIGR
jgi:hypothetical protein